MKAVIEIETKLELDGTLRYVNEHCYGPYETDREAQTMYNRLVANCLHTGYFDKVLNRTNWFIRLTNGGTAFKQFRINELSK